MVAPFVIASALTLFFNQTLDEDSLGRYDLSGNYRGTTVKPVAITLVFFTFATVAHVAWSQMLRGRGIQYWLIYGIAAWVMLRVFWWISQSALRSPYLAVYSDRFSSVGGEVAIILAAILAGVGVTFALYRARKCNGPTQTWFGIGASAPFVAMMLIVTTTSSAGTMLYVILFSDLCVLGALGIGTRVYRWVSRRTSANSMPSVENPGGLGLRFGALLVVAVVVSVFGGLSLWIRHSVTLLPVAEFMLNWAIILCGLTTFVLVASCKLEKAAKLEWAGLVCLALLAITTFPESEYLRYPASSGYLEDYSRITRILTYQWPSAFVLMGMGLVLSMLLNVSTETKAIFVGAMLAAPFMFALAKPEVVRPSGQLDFMFVLEPTIVLIVVCGILFGMFGLSRIYVCQSMPSNSN